MSEVTRSGDRSGEEVVDLVAFNGYPDLPEEAPNPPRRHRVAATVVATLVGIATMLVAAWVAPAVDGLLVYLVLLVPLLGGCLIALAAWDHLVEHRRPSLGSGVRDDRIELLASRAAMILWFAMLWLSPVLTPRPDDRIDPVRATAIGLTGAVLLFLLFSLAALGFGRLVQRRRGDRAAVLVLVFVLAFAGATLLGGLWPRFEEGMRMGQGGHGRMMANGIEVLCWGVPRESCERRAAFLLMANEAIHPDESPTMVEVGRPGGDWVCDGVPMVSVTCWHID